MKKFKQIYAIALLRQVSVHMYTFKSTCLYSGQLELATQGFAKCFEELTRRYGSQELLTY